MIRLTFKTPEGPDWTGRFGSVELEYGQSLFADGELLATFEDGFWTLVRSDDDSCYVSFNVSAPGGGVPVPEPPARPRFEVEVRRVTTEVVTVVVDEDDVRDTREAADFVRDQLHDPDWAPVAEGGEPRFGEWEVEDSRVLPEDG